MRTEKGPLQDGAAQAEYLVGITLAAMRHVPQAHQHLAEGGWDRKQFTGTELRGKTIALLGNEDSIDPLARRFAAFETTVHPYDSAENGSLESVLSSSDIIVITPSMTGNFGADQIVMIQDNSILIDATEDNCISPATIRSALESGKLKAIVKVLSDQMIENGQDWMDLQKDYPFRFIALPNISNDSTV